MLKKGCQNWEKQLCKSVHVESPSKYKSKDLPDLKGVEGGVKGEVLIPSDLQSLTFRWKQHPIGNNHDLQEST